MKILIVDDSESSRLLLKTYLEASCFTDISMADSAIEAINFLQSSKNENGSSSVDLILMDLMMPEINGIEATGMIKSDKMFCDIPIIIVTIKDEVESLEAALENGAVDYINKPVNKVELRARVRSTLKLKQEMDHRKAHEKKLEITISNLKKARDEVKKLTGLLPICAECKNIRDDKGYWQKVEKYIMTYSDVKFSHGLCPKCIQKLYPDMAEVLLEGKT